MRLGSLKCHLGKLAPFHIAWLEEYVFALGVAFAYDSNTSYRINFEKKLVTLKKVLNQWTTGNLTLIGRICIVKTLAISKLVYNASVLTVPPNLSEKVSDICFKFIWNFKGQVVRATFSCNLWRNIVAKLCCPYYHPRKQLVKHQDLLPKVEPSSTSCNMLLQLATLKFVARRVACGGGNTGNKALQLAKQQCCTTSCLRKCCPYYLTLSQIR